MRSAPCPTVTLRRTRSVRMRTLATAVGITALATDADGDTVTYSLDDDASGLFTIDANTGEVTVAGNLDYETATSHTITVRATSTDGSSSTADMTINVADVTDGDTDNAIGAVSDSDASLPTRSARTQMLVTASA